MSRTARLAALLAAATLVPAGAIAADTPATQPPATDALAAATEGKANPVTRPNISNNRGAPPPAATTEPPATPEPAAVLKTKTRSNQSND